MEQYEYGALPSPTSIRLLKFNQEESRKGPLITCSFVVVDTSGPPSPGYVALSYVWGSASDTVAISLEGKAMQVTKNLAAALALFSAKPALLWADALCINQEDNTEKSHQVNMMATIYGKATMVTVWLGPDPHKDAHTVFQAIEALTIEGAELIVEAGGRFLNFDEETGDLHWRSRDGRNRVWTLPKMLVGPDQGEKAKLERFFRLPWFSRTWILQEVGLAAYALVLWGDDAMEWHAIGLAAMFLKRYCKPLLLRLGLATEIEKVFHVYTMFSPFTPLATFIHVIHNARGFDATKPQDKLYALLSHPAARDVGMRPLWTNWGAYKPASPLAYHLSSYQEQFMIENIAEARATGYQPPDALPPPLWQADYSKSVAEVYRDVTLDYINRTKSLEILTTVQHAPDDNSELFSPSWVPRWDYFVDTAVLGLSTSTHFASSNKDVILTPSPPAQLDTLIVRGALISRAVHHTGLLEPSSFDLPLPDTTVVGPDSSEVQNKWTTNPIAKMWLQKLVTEHPESYPFLPYLKVETPDRLYLKFKYRASNLHRAFMRTWVAGKNMGEVDGFDLWADSDAYWERLFWGSEGKPEGKLERQTQQLVSLLGLPDDQRARSRHRRENEMRWKRYRDAAATVCNKRKFFVTKKGHFGLGPGAMREDDFVAVLLGADVPFVIREVLEDEEERDMEVRRRENKPVPMDRKFQLIGECYVDGLMQGQATKAVDFVRDIRLI
ncbi:hypothetical protein DL765_009111 [Monosporascus sp. GIB2]|nr:hypothetical protein DL765_009111 [Monosporascus sp. GIB2]